MEDYYALKPGALWKGFWSQHPSFWFLCLYFVTEYVRPQSLFGFLDGVPVAQISLSLTLLTWVLDPKKTIHWSGTFFWMLAFVAVCFISALTAYHPGHAVSQLYQIYLWIPIVFLTISITNSRQRFFLLLLLFFLSSFKLSQHGARTWAGRGFGFEGWGLSGPGGFFENSGELSIQMLVFFPLAFYAALALRPWLPKWGYWFVLLAALTGMMTIMGASSRGAQVSMAAVIGYMIIRNRINLRAIAALLVVAVVGYLVLPEEQLDRFTRAGEDATSVQRLLYWENGTEMILDHPAFGVGFFNFQSYFHRNYPEDVLLGVAELPHNIFIQVGTDTGLTGLFIYGLLLWLGFAHTRWIIRHAVPDKVCFDALIAKALAAGLWGYILAGQFVSVAYYPFMWVQLALILCHRVIVERDVAEHPATGRRRLKSR